MWTGRSEAFNMRSQGLQLGAILAAAGLSGVAAGYGLSMLQLPGSAWFVAGGGTALGLVGGAAALRLQRRRHRAEIERAVRRLDAPDDDLAEVNDQLHELIALASRKIDTAGDEGRRSAERCRELELKVRVLDHQRRHLEAILNALSDAVIVTDAYGELAIANDAAARLFGFDLADSAHQPVGDIVADPTVARLIKDVGEASDTTVRRNVEHRLTVDGEPRCFQITLGGVRAGREAVASEAGGVGGPASTAAAPARGGGVVTILRDITRDKEIAEMKSDFVSRVSHELRTPLSSIKAYVEMLIDGEAHDEYARAEFYDIIQNETNRLSRLIDNILSISRIESGVVKVSRENLSLAQLIKDAVGVIQPQAQAKRIELHREETPLFFQVHADRDMIFQAIINLLSNAVKYTPEGGRVSVSVSVDEQARTVETSVTDTGAGIPEEAVAHVFDKFYRVKSHGKLAKGTGLGLALVKHVVETVHGGKVSLTSTVDAGSTFTITLPMVRR